jgi:alkaline phosphatase D
MLCVFLTACSNRPMQADEDELAAREVGNTGGLNYGEFGPPDAYENGSSHPFYGSENEWSRRMFEQRAADLYYKRRGQRQMLEIIDGNPANALVLADARLAADPADAESMYIRTVALTRIGDLDAAIQSLREALDAGLPFSRFQAGPRSLLAPLTSSAAYKQLEKTQGSAIVHGPMIGAVTDSSARFWLRTAEETSFEISISDGNQERTVAGATRQADDFTGIARVDGLKADTSYRYTVRIVDEDITTSGPFELRTSPAAGSKGTYVVGFGGCAGYTPANERMWDTIASHELSAFLFLGDNVYIDLPEMPGPFHEYSYYRRQSRPEFSRLISETPPYAIWDDHDAAFDDIWLGPYVDTPAWKQPMVNSFRQNWNNPAYGTETSPGTWFSFVIGDVEFFMLDGRTYRSNPFLDNPSMLGAEQKNWLLRGLEQSTATFKVIASPVAWADGAKPNSVDTWSGFAAERDDIFSFVEDNDLRGVILLSSDRHRSEAWKIERDSGYPFYDLLSGQLTNIHTHPAEEGALFSYNAKDSFGVLTFRTDQSDPEVSYQIYSIDNELIEALVIRLSDLKGISKPQK